MDTGDIARATDDTMTVYVCADDRTITPAWQRKAARELLGVEPVELPGGHCPHVSRLESLAEVLERMENK